MDTRRVVEYWRQSVDGPGDIDLETQWVRRGLSASWVVGGKPNINLLCDIPSLQGVAAGTHETLDGHIVDIDTIRMIASDCSLTRIVLGPESEILDIGRKTRVWTPAQRRSSPETDTAKAPDAGLDLDIATSTT